MRTIFFSLLFFVFAYGNAQTLTGKRVSREFSVKSFNALKASGVINLTLVQGSKESVTVEADEGLQAYVTIANNGNTLEIDTKKLNNKNLKGNWKLNLTVYFRNLAELQANTVGHLRNEGTLKAENLNVHINGVGNTYLRLETQKLNLEASSVGNIELAGSAKTAVLRNSSVGNIRAENLKIGSLDINNSGIGNAEVNADEITGVQSSALGRVRNKGQKVKNYD